MADHPSVGLKGGEASPLHELISQILVSDESSQGGEASGLPMLGTMQQLNQRLANQPGLDFIEKMGLKPRALSIHRLWIKIEMVEIPKVGGCEVAFSRHPRT